MTLIDLEKELMCALGKVTYSHAGLDDVLAQLFSAYGGFRQGRGQGGYRLARDIAFQRKAQLIEGLMAEAVDAKEVPEAERQQVFALLKTAKSLTEERNRIVHDLIDVWWQGTPHSGSHFVTRSSPKLGKGPRVEEVKVAEILDLAEQILKTAEGLAAFADARMTE